MSMELQKNLKKIKWKISADSLHVRKRKTIECKSSGKEKKEQNFFAKRIATGEEL
jgi:hypothetical protein